MSEENQNNRVTLNWSDDGSIHLCGDLDASGMTKLKSELNTLFDESLSECVIELEALELLDVQAVIGMVELLRALRLNAETVTVIHAPQILAHTLYRLGDLERTGLRLIEPRQEEPYE